MPCEQLEQGYLICCKAVSGVLIPSIHERERYCRSDENHSQCPTLQSFQRAQRPLAQAEYYALWTVPKRALRSPEPRSSRPDPESPQVGLV